MMPKQLSDPFSRQSMCSHRLTGSHGAVHSPAALSARLKAARARRTGALAHSQHAHWTGSCCRQQSSPAAALGGRTYSRAGQLSSQSLLPTQLAQQGALPRLQHQQGRGRRTRHIARAADPLVPLGLDFLTFLGTTVLVIPLFKQLKISPILGFLFSGVVLQQLGLLKDLKDVERLSELGVLFLLFEMGLELSLDRLKALSKYAFGMGTLQVAITTLAFTAFALPVGTSFGTWFLEIVCHAPPSLVSIRSVDEAVVIAAALSMSSSAFVLQLLQERGEMASRIGQATLGILLFQDIAVVPFLVLLPLIEKTGGMEGTSADSLLAMLGPTALQTVVGLAALLLGGRFVLKRIFEMVAASRSNETFVALCLLTVTGASMLTKSIGLSDTLGAFIAGVLLSETSYRTQVEADIRPFRGLLLGLFFVAVGSSINIKVLVENWDVIGCMMIGLVLLKAAVIASLGPIFGLSRAESIRTGYILSQGGEFAFVLLSLANQLKLLPNELNQILIVVVVLSMALTPWLAEVGGMMAVQADQMWPISSRSLDGEDMEGTELDKVDDPVVVIGFGPQGQMLANMLSLESTATGGNLRGRRLRYVAFDLDPACIRAARKAGFSVLFGDGSRESVLKAAGVKAPRAFAVSLPNREAAVAAVRSVRLAFPAAPVFASAQDFRHAAELQDAGAARVVINNSEAGLTLGSQLLEALGASEVETSMLRRDIAGAMAVRTDALAGALGKAEASGGSRKNAVEVFALDPRALMTGGGATASMMDANAGGLLQSPMSSFEEMEPINGSSRSSSRAGSADESVSGSSIGSVGSSMHESMHESSLASVDSIVMSADTRGTAVRTMSTEDVSGSMHQEQKHSVDG